jgi:hypothetical protein
LCVSFSVADIVDLLWFSDGLSLSAQRRTSRVGDGHFGPPASAWQSLPSLLVI